MSRGRPTPPEVIALARTMWVAHERVEVIADAIGVSPLSVKHWRQRYGWPSRHKRPTRPVRAVPRKDPTVSFVMRRCESCEQLTPGPAPCRWCGKWWDGQSSSG